MQSKEIKVELHKAVDALPDKMVNHALDYLKTLIEKPESVVDIKSNLSTILEEDKELLKRLAK